VKALAALALLAGCYAGDKVSPDINKAWRGRSRASIEARWGTPEQVVAIEGGTALVWSYETKHVELPTGSASLEITETSLDFAASLQPGSVWTSKTEVVATLDAAGTVQTIRGPSVRWGAPADANLRSGVIFGMHAGMGRLDDTDTALPSGGLYIGGMLGPRLGLAGQYSMVFGKDNAGGAVGFAWGLGVHWWPATKVALRAGPALVLDLDPGFDNAAVAPGINGGASFALVRSGSFVLDLRFDATAAPDATFANIGVGVNVN
jgi:hypothetical protein